MKKLLGDVEVNNMSGRDPTSFENERSEALPGSERDIYEFLCRENNIKVIQFAFHFLIISA